MPRLSQEQQEKAIGLANMGATRRHLARTFNCWHAHHPEIDESQTIIVNFNACGASSLDFFIYCFTHTVKWVRYHEIKQDVLLKIMTIIEQHGADCAFPTQTLYIEQDVAEMGINAKT